MAPGLSVQQMAAAIGNFKRRLKAKQLQCDALDRLRKLGPSVINHVLQGDAPIPPAEREAVTKAADDYLTGVINWLLIDIQEYELQIKMLESQQSGIVLGGGGAFPVPPKR